MKEVHLVRWQVVAAFAALTAVFVFQGFWLGMQNNRTSRALHELREVRAESLRRAAATNKVLCDALNESRAINNRDRATFVRSLANTEGTYRFLLAIGTAPKVARAFVEATATQTKAELAARPQLEAIDCSRIGDVVGGLAPPPPKPVTGS